MLFPLCRWILETLKVLFDLIFYPLYKDSLYQNSKQQSFQDLENEDADPIDLKKRMYDKSLFYSRYKEKIPQPGSAQLSPANPYQLFPQSPLPRPFEAEQARRRGSHPANQAASASMKASPEPRHRKQLNEFKPSFPSVIANELSPPEVQRSKSQEIYPSSEYATEKTTEFGIKNSQPLIQLDRFTILSTSKQNNLTSYSTQVDYLTNNTQNNNNINTTTNQSPHYPKLPSAPLPPPGPAPPVIQNPSNTSGKNYHHEHSSLPLISFQEIQYIQTIGSGGFGQVWKGMWKGTPVAVKMLNPVCQSTTVPDKVLIAFEEEVAMLARLRHPNICLLLGVCLEPSHRLIVTELVSRGSLWEALRTPALFQVSFVFLFLSLCFFLTGNFSD
jgi:hypothetical protein